MALLVILTYRKEQRLHQSQLKSNQLKRRKRKAARTAVTEGSSSSHSSEATEAEDIESDLESLEEHYYSDLRQYTANLELAFSKQLNRQQLNNQEWDFNGGREGIQRFLAPYHLASGKADVPNTGFKKANGNTTADVLL